MIISIVCFGAMLLVLYMYYPREDKTLEELESLDRRVLYVTQEDLECIDCQNLMEVKDDYFIL